MTAITSHAGTFSAPAWTTSQRSVRTGLCCLIGLVIGSSFALISFQSAAAIATIEAEENQFHRSENKAADRQRDVTMHSAVGYLLLGGSGLLAFFWPKPNATRPHGALWWVLIAYMAWVLASGLWADDRMFTARKLVIFVLFMSAVLGFTKQLSLREVAITIGGVAFSFIMYGVLVEFSLGSFTPWKSHYRFSGTVHPNEQGLYCAFAGLAAMFLRGRKPGWETLTGLVVFSSSFGFLLLTKSRTGLAAVLAALALGALLRTSSGKRGLVVLGSLTALALGLLALGATGSAGARGFGNAASLGRGEHVTSLTGRLPLWAELIDRASTRPWLGHGFSGFWTADNIEEISDQFFWHIPSGHSVYIDLVLALGVIGLVLYLTIIFLGLRRALAAYRLSNSPEYVFAVSLLLLSLVHGFAESKFAGVGLSAFSAFSMIACMCRVDVSRSVLPETLV